MKKIMILLSVVILLLFENCSTWKNTLVSNGNINDAINNAVTDFLYSSSLSKKDSVFNIKVTNLNDEQLVIGIMGRVDKIFIKPENKIGTNNDKTFPTNYFIRNGKLFLWYDPNKSISTELMSILIQYNHIDSLWRKEGNIPPYTIDDGKKGVLYYFCKKNLKNYKKTGSNTINRHYSTPKLNCR